ncbi:enoyl-CoA hydratase/isomerase family protein [Metabacillus litoralis]|jgi:2-(1,2-epoxy-1,2-dihydrophenyl)acetyl-CoA isomerase|uniref:enoyl-CoA hydratase/isomerase family protein n=1 Tax=Metabacillus litoralis TaxID=152268 RepID=UPI00204183F0|nr:enoyl-CoA hydratase/isomerase family protein [Metabacillus litoralis]MCM3651761.1 enoyl-CoA hydratase/isomerase family protein [Metabacillus litoralis]
MSCIKTVLNDDTATAYIYLDSKETKNSLDVALATSLLEEVKKANNSSSIKTIVFLSEHRAFFSSGPSLPGLLEIAENQNDEELKNIVENLNELITQIYYSPKITIVGFNGYAYGGGLNVFLGCDYRVAVERTKFIENFHKMGVTSDLSSSYFLPRLIGMTRTMSIILSGDLFTAWDAKDWGLFNEVFSTNKEMKSHIETFCEKINEDDFTAIQMTKQLVKQSFQNGLEKQLEIESKALRDSFKNKEVVKRLRSILDYSII